MRFEIRFKLSDEYNRQITGVFQQWESDLSKSKDQEDKLQVNISTTWKKCTSCATATNTGKCCYMYFFQMNFSNCSNNNKSYSSKRELFNRNDWRQSGSYMNSSLRWVSLAITHSGGSWATHCMITVSNNGMWKYVTPSGPVMIPGFEWAQPMPSQATNQCSCGAQKRDGNAAEENTHGYSK